MFGSNRALYNNTTKDLSPQKRFFYKIITITKKFSDRREILSDENTQQQYQHCLISILALPHRWSSKSIHCKLNLRFNTPIIAALRLGRSLFFVKFLIIYVQILFRSMLIVKFNWIQFFNRAFDYSPLTIFAKKLHCRFLTVFFIGLWSLTSSEISFNNLSFHQNNK